MKSANRKVEGINKKDFGVFYNLVIKWCVKNDMCYVLPEFKELFDDIKQQTAIKVYRELIDVYKNCKNKTITPNDVVSVLKQALNEIK